MSLVNQMLQDLEKRRTGGANISPTGGLYASSTELAATQTHHYMLTGLVLILAFVTALAFVYLFSQKQSITTASPEVLQHVGNNLPSLQNETYQHEVSNQKAIPEKPVPYVTSPKQAEAALANTTTIDDAPAPIETTSTPVRKKQAIRPLSASTDKPTPVAIPVTAKSLRPKKSNTPPRSVIVKAVETKSVPTLINKSIRPLTIGQQAQAAYQHAIKLLESRDPSGARLALEESLSLQASYVPAREALAALLMNSGQFSEAEEILATGLQLQPEAAPLAILQARLLASRGNTRVAITVMEKARPALAENPGYFTLLAAFYRSTGNHAKALHTYQQLLQLNSDVAVWWIGLALSHDAAGSESQALAAYRQAIRMQGLHPKVLQYAQSRIQALASVVSATPVNNNSDDFEDQ